MSFQQGLSGLNVSSKALDAVGNNISNVGTVGFKAAKAQFNDVYAAALGGAVAGNAIGQGAAVMTVAQTFTQGNITNTNNPLDIAINGNGFLQLQPSLTDQTKSYTRNGQLHLDALGYLVNAQDMYLTAYSSPDGENLNLSAPAPLQLSSAPIEPKATGYSNILVPGTGGVDISMNFDVRDKRANVTSSGLPAQSDWTALQDWNFSTLNPNMYNYSTSATIYDQKGEPHILTMYFVRQGVDDGTGAAAVGGSSWQPHLVLDSEYEITQFTNNGAAPTVPASLDFSPNGQMNTSANGTLYTLDLTGTSVFDVSGAAVDLTAAPYNYFPDAVTEPTYALTIDFENATQFGSSYDVNRLAQDGYATGRISGVSIDSDGKISARYSNGKTKLMGQVALTTFQNPNGLVPLGNNLYVESAASGPALTGAPNSGSKGAIQAGAVEDANVDLTEELVNMITLQRTYQANAQTIKTQDQILQTLVNLR
jgi:flagellar hook protein FlgE